MLVDGNSITIIEWLVKTGGAPDVLLVGRFLRE